MEPVTTAALISGGTKLLGGIFGSKANKKAAAEQARIAEQNRQDALARFAEGKQLSLDELLRQITETDEINADFRSQQEGYDEDTEGLRSEGRDIYAELLAQVKGAQEPGEDGDLGEENVASVLAGRARARDRGEADAVDAASRIGRYQTELGQRGPDAASIESLLRARGNSAITRSYEETGNKAAAELSRTGGNGEKVFAKMAQERAAAMRDNDIEAALGGISGAEQLSSSKASRLNPVINALSTRQTAMPDATAEMQNQATRGQLNVSKGQLGVQRGGNLASLASTATAPLTLRKSAPQALGKSPGLDMRFLGTPMANVQSSITPEATSAGATSALLSDIGDLFNPNKIQLPTARR